MKTLRRIGFSVIAVLLAFCAVGCSSDDDDDDSGVVIPYYAYYVEASDTLLSIADVTVHFTGEDGVEQTYEMTNTSWMKKVPVTRLPAKIQAYVSYDLKEGIDESPSYKVRLQALHDVQGFDAKGFMVTDLPQKFCNYMHGTVRAGMIKKYMETNKNMIDYNMYEVVIDKDAKGKLTVQYVNL